LNRKHNTLQNRTCSLRGLTLGLASELTEYLFQPPTDYKEPGFRLRGPAAPCLRRRSCAPQPFPVLVDFLLRELRDELDAGLDLLDGLCLEHASGTALDICRIGAGLTAADLFNVK
jgi:hypothetical protein